MYMYICFLLRLVRFVVPFIADCVFVFMWNNFVTKEEKQGGKTKSFNLSCPLHHLQSTHNEDKSRGKNPIT